MKMEQQTPKEDWKADPRLNSWWRAEWGYPYEQTGSNGTWEDEKWKQKLIKDAAAETARIARQEKTETLGDALELAMKRELLAPRKAAHNAIGDVLTHYDYVIKEMAQERLEGFVEGEKEKKKEHGRKTWL